jgi:hypothetical protein
MLVNLDVEVNRLNARFQLRPIGTSIHCGSCLSQPGGLGASLKSRIGSLVDDRFHRRQRGSQAKYPLRCTVPIADDFRRHRVSAGRLAQLCRGHVMLTATARAAARKKKKALGKISARRTSNVAALELDIS